MSWEFMMPRKDYHTNGVLKAPPGKENEIHDLPVTFTNVGIASVWSCSLWARVKFLFHGRIIFLALTNNHPPINLVIGTEYFEKKGEK
jgi:hypothetical protein